MSESLSNNRTFALCLPPPASSPISSFRCQNSHLHVIPTRFPHQTWHPKPKALKPSTIKPRNLFPTNRIPKKPSPKKACELTTPVIPIPISPALHIVNAQPPILFSPATQLGHPALSYLMSTKTNKLHLHVIRTRYSLQALKSRGRGMP